MGVGYDEEEQRCLGWLDETILPHVTAEAATDWDDKDRVARTVQLP